MKDIKLDIRESAGSFESQLREYGYTLGDRSFVYEGVKEDLLETYRAGELNWEQTNGLLMGLVDVVIEAMVEI